MRKWLLFSSTSHIWKKFIWIILSSRLIFIPCCSVTFLFYGTYMQFSIYFSRARKNAFYSPLMVFVNRHLGLFFFIWLVMDICSFILNLLFEIFLRLSFFNRIWELIFKNYNIASNCVVCNHLLNITLIFLLALTKWPQPNKLTKTNSSRKGWVLVKDFSNEKCWIQLRNTSNPIQPTNAHLYACT